MRYFITFLVALGLLFLVIFLLFNSGGNKPKTPVTTKTLDSYASTDAQVQMTIDGPVNAVQDHQQVRIIVSSNDVTYEQIQGYDGDIVNRQDFANTGSAYSTFLLSLAHGGFTEGNNTPAYRDERGLCPLGDRYIFELNQDGHDIERYWATSCGSPKSYLGNLNLTVALFEGQVPNYPVLTENLKF